MTTPTIDTLAHRAARFSRRRSLLTLGGAVIAATTATVEPGFAKKNKKNGRKGNGGDCKKREQQRCSSDATACKATVQLLCNVDNPDVELCLLLQTCCEECSAGGFLTCAVPAPQA